MSPEYAKRILRKIGWGIVIAFVVLIIGLMIGYGVGGGQSTARLSAQYLGAYRQFLAMRRTNENNFDLVGARL